MNGLIKSSSKRIIYSGKAPMLKFFGQNLTKTRTGRHLLSKLSNHKDFDPIYDAIANRVLVSLARLKDLGFSPDLVVDVGAYEGHWTTMVMPIFPQADFLMVEAQPSKATALEGVRARAPDRISVAMGLLGAAKQENVRFFAAETGSSIYEENTAFARDEVLLPMSTLDEVLAERPSERILVKLDVQGAELDVLAGAKATLSRTGALLLEVSLVEYNRGAPRFAEVVTLLSHLGFVAFDIVDLRRVDGVLAQVDIIFVEKNSDLAKSAANRIALYGS